MDVVKKMEAVGSQAGSTSKTVVIADCGQLPLGEYNPPPPPRVTHYETADQRLGKYCAIT